MAMMFNDMLDPAAEEARRAQEQAQAAAAPQRVNDPNTAQPPKDLQDLQGRITGWGNFLERLRTDPNMQKAALTAAAEMTRPVKPGESMLSNTLGGINQGVTAYDKLQGADAEGRRQEEQMQMRRAEQVRAEAGNTRATSAETRAAAEEARRVGAEPLTLRTAEAQAQAAEFKVKTQAEDHAMQVKVQQAQLAAAKENMARAKTNPHQESLQAQYDLVVNSGTVTLEAGETKDSPSFQLRVWKAVKEGLKDPNAGTDVQADMALIRAGEDVLADEGTKAAGKAALERLMVKRGGEAPAAGGMPTVTKQEEVEKLAPGTRYIYKGKVYTRGGR